MATPVTVLGNGAIGSLCAGRLARHGHPVTLLGRYGPVAEVRLDGDTITLKPGQAPALLLVCVKAYQVETALAPLLPALPADIPIVLMHNGLGPHLWVQANCPNPLVLASTTHGALKDELGVHHTGWGQCWYGSAGARPNPAQQAQIHNLLNIAQPQALPFDNVFEPLWWKLAINALINPLTARDGVRNGELCQASYRTELEALAGELAPVMQAEGIDASTEAILARTLQVARQTAANQSSMLRDRLAGRPTEIAFINGYICDRAEQRGLDAPRHRQLVVAIEALCP
ncbi:2-dehydropantoate 2-reductase [Gallaecimonas sp. GXIMD4217]|uniref:ketopantoate reductase family protein n=1 Tax=Gallaecimonas sp. GXIMD4217 TaxID=3131927 RepID=UPI00311B05AF